MPYITNPDWEKDLEVCPYCGEPEIEECCITTSTDNLTKMSHMKCHMCDGHWIEKYSFVKRVAMISSADANQKG